MGLLWAWVAESKKKLLAPEIKSSFFMFDRLIHMWRLEISFLAADRDGKRVGGTTTFLGLKKFFVRAHSKQKNNCLGTQNVFLGLYRGMK